jgi:hypothetical protein
LHGAVAARKTAGHWRRVVAPRLFAAPQQAGYTPPIMPDGIALPALAVFAAGLVALALVWPQGEGRQSPPPFGHPMAPIENPVAKALAPLALRGPEAVEKLIAAKPHRHAPKPAAVPHP